MNIAERLICFSFSYTDSIKVYERWGPGSVDYFGDPDSNLDVLKEDLKTTRISTLFTEVPSNPLLQTPNLAKIRELADKHGFIVVVDDTIGNFVNVDVMQYVDVVCTSLSKLFSGSANVMGGRYANVIQVAHEAQTLKVTSSLALNPNSLHYASMHSHLGATFVDDYYHEDAIVMEQNSRDFASRVHHINSNAVAASEFLRSRSLSFPGLHSPNPSSEPQRQFVIKDVFFPKWVTRHNYDRCRRPGSTDNFGPLLSLTFTSPEATHAFFNALPCAKGPSLGTNFTLACPYTILAHYNERPWAASYGVEEGIVRISIGMEDPETLMGWLARALRAAEKTKG
jgi:cystathionine gamma-synthase